VAKGHLRIQKLGESNTNVMLRTGWVKYLRSIHFKYLKIYFVRKHGSKHNF
jgi:hypothetical protein